MSRRNYHFPKFTWLARLFGQFDAVPDQPAFGLVPAEAHTRIRGRPGSVLAIAPVLLNGVLLLRRASRRRLLLEAWGPRADGAWTRANHDWLFTRHEVKRANAHRALLSALDEIKRRGGGP